MDTTLAIKTFDRPDSIRALLDSVRTRYPDLPIIVADDGHRPVEDICQAYDVDYHRLEVDTGLSAGRNYLMDQVETPYVVTGDDDFVFGSETDLDALVGDLDEGYDIVGGRLWLEDGSEQCYHGFMEQIGTVLHMYRPRAETLCPVHILLNFLAARTAVVRLMRWWEPLKIIEHEDFFWRCRLAGVRVGYDPRISCLHCRRRPEHYFPWRNRVAQFQAIARARWGWTDAIWHMI